MQYVDREIALSTIKRRIVQEKKMYDRICRTVQGHEEDE